MILRSLLAVMLAWGAFLGGPALAGETVDLTATDGVQLVGELDGTTGPGVVLADRGRGRAGFDATVAALASGGFRTLRFDFRPAVSSPEAVAAAAASERDLEAAYRYLLGRKIRTVYLVAVGSAGAAALRLAARVTVAGVVVVGSPAPPIDDASATTGVPTLVVPALDDDGIARMLRFLRASADPRAPAEQPRG